MCGRPTPQAQKRRHFRPFEMKQLKCALQVGETMVTRQGCTCSLALHSFQPEDEVDLKTQKPAACNTNHSWEKQTPPGVPTTINQKLQEVTPWGHHTQEKGPGAPTYEETTWSKWTPWTTCVKISLTWSFLPENNKSVSPMSKWLIAVIVAIKAVRDFGRRNHIQHSPWNR